MSFVLGILDTKNIALMLLKHQIEKNYDKEFKMSVIEEFTTGKYSLADLAAKYSITYALVYRWTK